MKHVIVTGATGFIGKTLAAEIGRRFGAECEVIALGSRVVDLARKDDTFTWFERTSWTFPCDHIIHLAALYKAGDWPVHHQGTQFHVNMSINVNLLEAWRRFMPAAKLTSILSYCMYPSHSDPHPETEVYGTEPEDYLFAYAFTKKAMLIGQKAYAREHGLKSTSVVLPTVYGPGDSFAEDSHVMGALVGKFVRAALTSAPAVEVWGDGGQEREFLYVDDAADGIIHAAVHSEEPILNLGTGAAYSIRDVASMIRDAAGFEGEMKFNLNRFVGVRRRVLDVSLMRNRLGWTAGTPIEDGIRRTVRWYSDDLGSTGVRPA
ncbi:MAG: NAD-dependent epimerase/dehydratase family protein [Hyphomicrobium sp.]|nr:NAD-dependent epimerase/dehydratase family protein [Hyphomicrobium sp.]